MTKDLESLLAEEITRFNGESNKHKKLFRWIQFWIIVLTALSASVSGLAILLPDPVEARFLQFGVLMITATISAITAYGEMRRSRELWQHERETFYALKDLHREVIFLENLKELTAEKQHEIFQRAQAILGSSTGQWVDIQSRKPTDAMVNKEKPLEPTA